MQPLVGRDPELATIDRFLRSIPEGYQAVVLRGGAGYGKSALLEETVARARGLGLRVLTARPAETEAELPFGVLTELLEPVETSGLDLSAPQARALDIALRRIDPDEANPVDPLALSLASHAALRELASSDPVLVAVDDLQWCDPPSLRTLAFALRRIDAERWARSDSESATLRRSRYRVPIAASPTLRSARSTNRPSRRSCVVGRAHDSRSR